MNAAFFVWSATLEKIFIMDNLRKRHIIVVDWYYMCMRCKEFADHLIIHCDFASVLWGAIFSGVGLP
jgi:hypothetical protein